MTTYDDVSTQLRIGADDLQRMAVQVSAWEGKYKPEDDFGDHFFPVPYDPAKQVSYAWRYGYWFERWADVVLARHFFHGNGEPYQIITDEHEGQYVILTNYYGPQPDLFLRKPQKETAQ